MYDDTCPQCRTRQSAAALSTEQQAATALPSQADVVVIGGGR